MTRRSGLTLVEVLTALFILALGVIAILTLFPLGAMQFAQAIRDSRSTESAFNADQYMRTVWKNQFEPGATPEAFYASFTTPVGGGLTPLTGENAKGPSYPVAVDPMGYVARQSTPSPSNPRAVREWIGDDRTFVRIPRHTLNSVGTNSQYALRLCSLMDTMGFQEGVPNGDRELRYNWLWVLQQPNITDPKTANMTVVVFDRRAHLHATLGAEDVLQASNTTPGLSSVTFDAFNAETKILPGTWIMDGTTTNSFRRGIRNANFYRVTAVNGNSVELQTPIKTPTDGIAAPYTATFVVWRGVSGVYVRNPLKVQN
jgi:hypothetical protein